MHDRCLLERLGTGPVSGDVLARGAGLTRAAIWKRIDALRAAGVEISAEPGRGYALRHPLSLLDADRIRAALPPAARGAMAGLEVAWSLDSTSSELLRRGPPAHGASVLIAERQTGGRGRRGRQWASPLAGQVAFSVARRFEGGLARLGGLSLVAGVAVAEALRSLGVAPVGLKWPNDLVVPGPGPGARRKLGGILVEGGGEHAGPAHAVVGVGINVRLPAAAAEAIDQPWTDLAACMSPAPGGVAGAAIDRNAVAGALLGTLLPALEVFEQEGLAPFVDRFAAFDALAGFEVLVADGDRRHAGVAAGVAPDGGLRLRSGDGREQVFHAGETSVRLQ